MGKQAIRKKLRAILSAKLPIFKYPSVPRLLVAHAGAGCYPAHKFYSMASLMENALELGQDVTRIADRSSGSWAMAGAHASREVGGTSVWVTVGSPPTPVRAFVEAKGGRFLQVDSNADRIAALEELVASGGYWCPDQHNNPLVVDAFENTLGTQIEGELLRRGIEPAFLVAGVGTGGSAAGIGRRLRRRWPSLRVVGTDLSSSIAHASARSWKPGQLKVRGVGSDDEICGTLRYARREIDETVEVNVFAAANAMRQFYADSVGCGMSGAMVLAAAFQNCLPRCPDDKVVVALLADRGEFYSQELHIANMIFSSEVP